MQRACLIELAEGFPVQSLNDDSCGCTMTMAIGTALLYSLIPPSPLLHPGILVGPHSQQALSRH